MDRHHAQEHDPGLDVVLVEADLCGAGASGRNGGCALSWSAKFFTLERLFGLTEAIRLVKASEDSIRAIGAFCQRYDVEADYRLDGTLYTATNPAQVGSTDSVIAALGATASTPSPSARWPTCSAAGSRRHLEAGSHRLPRRCNQASWFAACAGSPCNWGTPVRRHADARTGARPPGGSGHPTGGSSPAAWCWR